MMTSIRVLIMLAAAMLLVACSSDDGGQGLAYRNSVITPTLEVPPDLTQLSSEENLALPGSAVGTAANRGRFVETGNLNVEVRTLPRIEGITIQGEGDLRWLQVPEAAEKLYPQIRSFWAEQGFRLLRDEPAVGIMETEWLTEASGSDSFVTSILQSLLGADSRDQYQTRLERSADNQSTLVFVAHRRQEQEVIDPDRPTIDDDSRNAGWGFVAAQPAKEYEMISRMMLHLGMQDEAVRAELEKLGLFEARARIEFDEEDEETFLILKHGYQQAWNRVLLQLDRMSVRVLERDQDDNEGRVRIEVAAIAPGVEIEDEDDAEIYLSLQGSEASPQTRIDIENQNGTLMQSDLSRAILQTLQRQLK